MAIRFCLPSDTFFDDNGKPLSGGSIYFYETATTTPQPTYSDDALVTANTNPVVLDSAGRAGNVFLLPLDYKVIIKSAAGVTIKTMDPVHGATATSGLDQSFNTLADLIAYDGEGRVAGNLFHTSNTNTGDARAASYRGTDVTPSFTDKFFIVASQDGTFWYVLERPFLPKALPQAQHFWKKVRAGEDSGASVSEDAHILVISDSTGVASYMWPRLLANWLCTKCPLHTIKFRGFLTVANDSSDKDKWDTYTTLQTGAGPRTIFVDNCAVSGSTEISPFGARQDAVFDNDIQYDWVIASHGHNDGPSFATEEVFFSGFVEYLSTIKALQPRAAHFVTLQNPRLDYPNGSALAVTAWRKAADLFGCGIINAYDPLLAIGLDSLGPYMIVISPGVFDQIHAGPLGSKVWAYAAQCALDEDPCNSGASFSAPAALHETKANFFPDPLFTDLTKWSTNHMTLTADISKGYRTWYAMKCVAQVGGSSRARMNLDLSALRGQWVTLSMLIWHRSGDDHYSGTIGFVGTISGTSGSRLVPPETVGIPLYASDGWHLAVSHIYVDPDETSLQVQINGAYFANAVGGETVWVAYAVVNRGLVPGDIDFSNTQIQLLADYYDPSEVIKKPNFDGTLVVSGKHITLTGATSVVGGGAGARFYLLLEYLTVGASYTLTWTRIAGSAVSGTVVVIDTLDGLGSQVANGLLGDGTISFTATNRAMSVSFSGSTADTGLEINDTAIVLLAQPSGGADTIGTRSSVLSADKTLAAIDLLRTQLCNATSAAIAVTLPATANADDWVTVRKTDSSANRVKVKTSLGTEIAWLSAQNDECMFVFWGGVWVPTRYKIAPLPQVFTSSGTYTKPPLASRIRGLLIGGGGPGGAGMRGATSTARSGGGGGAPGCLVQFDLAASGVSATETVTVGATRSGPAGQSVDSTTGATGSQGNTTSFGSHFAALGGLPGSGGDVTAVSGGGTSTVSSNFGSPGSGGTASITAAPTTPTSMGAGAAGGTLTTANAAFAGAKGADGSLISSTAATGGAGGASDTDGTDGTAIASSTDQINGGGGGGGGPYVSTKGGKGGNGAAPGGGGGGGGPALNSHASGAGGDGARGEARVTAYF